MRKWAAKVRFAGAALVLALGIGGPAESVSCVQGTAADYETLGATGCTIGDKTFSNFVFNGFPEANITVIPGTNIVVAGDIGFTLQIDGFAAIFPALTSDDLLLNYTVSAPSATITDAHLSFTGSANGAGGLASVSETLCPVGHPCLQDILEVFDSPTSTVVSDQAFFRPSPEHQRPERYWCFRSLGGKLCSDLRGEPDLHPDSSPRAGDAPPPRDGFGWAGHGGPEAAARLTMRASP